MLAAVHHSSADPQTLIGWIVVLVCLALAAYCAYLRNVVAVILLLVVALITWYVLL
jgi:hypothetical protein